MQEVRKRHKTQTTHDLPLLRLTDPSTTSMDTKITRRKCRTRRRNRSQRGRRRNMRTVRARPPGPPLITMSGRRICGSRSQVGKASMYNQPRVLEGASKSVYNNPSTESKSGNNKGVCKNITCVYCRPYTWVRENQQPIKRSFLSFPAPFLLV